MKNKNIYIVLVLVFSCFSAAMAQDKLALKPYSATVTNEQGYAVTGAMVNAQLAKTKEVSDAKGDFTIQVAEGDLVAVSMPGYQPVIISTKDTSTSIVLQNIDVVSSDYKYGLSQGSVPFERITGSVERITGEELSDYSGVYVKEALAGRLSGLTSQYGNGEPTNESFSNKIRGGSGDIFVNGVVANITETINEVDEIIIAKDYASSFMYGGTSADGAIIMNTKRGNPGENLMEFSVNTGVRNPTHITDMMDAAQYTAAYNQSLIAEGLDPVYSPENYVNGSDAVRYPNNNYADLLTDASKYTQVNADFSGGNSSASYFSHIGYYGTDGTESVADKSNLTRLRTNNNVDINLGDYAVVNLGVGAKYEITKGHSFSGNDIYGLYANYPPNAFPYMLNDSVYAKSNEYSKNPYAEQVHGGTFERTERDVNSRIGLDLDLNQVTEGLNFEALYSIYVSNILTQALSPSPTTAEPYYVQDQNGNDSLVLRKINPGEDDRTWSKSEDRVVRNQYLKVALNYDRQFSEDHSLIASLQLNKSNRTGTVVKQDDIRQNIGLNANYMLYQKYVLDAMVSNTAVRQISASERERLNYAGGIAWLLHKESFLDNIASLSMLKLRANYGVQTLPIDYFYINHDLYISSGAGTFGVENASSGSSGYIRTFTATPDIKLPTKSYLNVGLDYAFLNGNLSGQINYFSKRTKDDVTVPVNIFPLVQQAKSYIPLMNYGDRASTGLDGRIKYKRRINDFKFCIDANMMYMESYVSKSDNVDYPETYRNVNMNLGGRILGLEADGIFTSQEEIGAALPQNFSVLRPGDIKYKDYNNDGVIDRKDIHEIGHSPRVFYGLNLMLAYKNFTFSAHGDGVMGGSYTDSQIMNLARKNYPTRAASSWPNSTELPRISEVSNSNNAQKSSLYLRNASYFNLRNVNLTYNLPAELLLKTPLKSASVHLSGRNLAVFSANDDSYMLSRNKGFSEHPIMNAFELGLDVKF